jgi:O-Antigen ligase
MLHKKIFTIINQSSAIKLRETIEQRLGILVAIAVFFQFYLKLSGGLINLNMADPFAFLAIIIVSYKCLYYRKLPVWMFNQFNLILSIISVLLFLGFVNGWLSIGLTQWAFGGRLIGWLILLGFLLAGYLVVSQMGNLGLHMFLMTLTITAAFVVVFQMGVRLLALRGIDVGIPVTVNFDGFSANRNAFAFQLLAVVSLILGFSKVYVKCLEKNHKNRDFLISSCLFGIVLVGLFWTGSRAGIAVGLLLLLSTWITGLSSRKLIGSSIAFAILIWIVVWVSVNGLSLKGDTIESISIEKTFSDGTPIKSPSVQSDFSTSASNQERLATFKHALDLWREAPLIGVGLGVFIAKSPAWFTHPQVIHNTALWILAEFGLVGIAVFCWMLYELSRYLFSYRRLYSRQRALLMLLIVFLTFSLAHEIFYQRIFWLVLGVLLAKPFARVSRV